jgi:hypothetical protein
MPIDFDALKKYKSLDAGDYDEDMRGQVLDVWINPSRAVWNAFTDKDIPMEDRVVTLYSAIWGMSQEDCRTLYENAESALWTWLVNTSMELVNEYSDRRKKAEKD